MFAFGGTICKVNARIFVMSKRGGQRRKAGWVKCPFQASVHDLLRGRRLPNLRYTVIFQRTSLREIQSPHASVTSRSEIRREIPNPANKAAPSYWYLFRHQSMKLMAPNENISLAHSRQLEDATMSPMACFSPPTSLNQHQTQYCFRALLLAIP